MQHAPPHSPCCGCTMGTYCEDGHVYFYEPIPIVEIEFPSGKSTVGFAVECAVFFHECGESPWQASPFSLFYEWDQHPAWKIRTTHIRGHLTDPRCFLTDKTDPRMIVGRCFLSPSLPFPHWPHDYPHYHSFDTPIITYDPSSRLPSTCPGSASCFPRTPTQTTSINPWMSTRPGKSR